MLADLVKRIYDGFIGVGHHPDAVRQSITQGGVGEDSGDTRHTRPARREVMSASGFTEEYGVQVGWTVVHSLWLIALIGGVF